MPRFAVEIKQLVIVDTDDEVAARQELLDDPPHLERTVYGQSCMSFKTTERVEILTWKPFKGRTPKRRRP